MATDDYPWEPPLAGTEVEHLLGTLKRLRTTFRWKADDLDEAGLTYRIPSSSLTLGGLLKHLAADEDSMFTVKLTGASIGEPWESIWPDGAEYHVFTLDPTGHTPEELYSLWDGAVARSDARIAAALERGGLDQPTALGFGADGHASLRRLLFDLIEEYGRHTGHADLIREAVDGRVGEDPPAGWTPVSGRAG
ncbi:DUF664 domain-containing protein [Occultella kanbiaonis]|uniref:mycothiol transferase n=1 Tax=Occultella kanbiaonis TaxID=2675754 RepID=UPI0013D1ED21|nr:DUF664 domain-containing protein [Occultella kanbiaonis]